MKYALKVEQLTINYGKMAALWDLNFSIPEGTLVGIIGPNGAGKSTLLKGLLNMVPSLSGDIEFFGEPLKKARKKIAYVPQRAAVDWDFPITVRDATLMGRYGRLGLFKWLSNADKKAALEALEMVGMLPFAERQISQLSGGQQQRVFIARALVQEADLYLMDEPFAGVDSATERALVSLFNELRGERKTLLVVHHDLNSVRGYFDWVLMLNTCLISSGPVDEAFSEETIQRAYGEKGRLLEEAARLSHERVTGLI